MRASTSVVAGDLGFTDYRKGGSLLLQTSGLPLQNATVHVCFDSYKNGAPIEGSPARSAKLKVGSKA